MSPDFDTLVADATALIATLREKKLTLATAESCTGGLIAAILTEVPGASDVFERGFVTYSNAAKTELLNVDADLITEEGAVSEVVALAMAWGALEQAQSDVTVSVTGIAGPGGGTAAKPVGLVYLAAVRRGNGVLTREMQPTNPAMSRRYIRHAAVVQAFDLVRSLL